MECRPFDEIITSRRFEELVKQAADSIFFFEGFLYAYTFYERVTISVVYTNGDSDWDFELDYDDFGVITGNCKIISCEREDSNIPYEFINKLSSLINAERSNYNNDFNNDESDSSFYDSFQYTQTNTNRRKHHKRETPSIFDTIKKDIEENRGPKHYKLIGALIWLTSVGLLVGGACALITNFISESKKPPSSEHTIFLEEDYSYFRNKNYVDVQSYFVDKGFLDVKLKSLHDMTFGWIYTENAVENVTIDGKDDFHSETWYIPTAKVVISYHSFK